MSSQAIYLDSAASTAIDPRVTESMIRALSHCGNPHAQHHTHGALASSMVRQARSHVASAIGASPDEIVFTSGATEANNLAVLGLCSKLRSSGKTHIVVGAVEHSSVLEPLRASSAYSVSVIAPKPCGMIDASMIEPHLTDQTGLVCLQAVNNEVGTIQPVSEVAELLHKRNIFLHCDAAQALGKISFNVRASGVDFATISSHKFHGPPGIGALYIRKELSSTLLPQLFGGGQEQGLRSGTLSTPLCVGFGTACELLDNDNARLWSLRQRFLKALAPLAPTTYEHKDPAWQVPGIISLRFHSIDQETLVTGLPKLSFGTGAACRSRGTTYSHVISAIAGEAASRETIRISLSRMSSEHEVDTASEMIAQFVQSVRKLKEVA